MDLTLNYNSKDYSLTWEDFKGDGTPVSLLSTEFILIGYHKPISNFYIELFNAEDENGEQAPVSESLLKVEYENNTGFIPVTDLHDYTLGLNGPGKLCWTPEYNNQIKTIKFGKVMYWYKLSASIDAPLRTIIGINTIFSYDSDLEEEYPNINKFLPEDEQGNKAKSFIKFHMSARKEIVQILRKKFIMDKKLLDQFDLLNIDEVRQASKYLTLAKIFFWLADTVDDKWRTKSKEYDKTFADFIDAVTLTIDKNDNGVIDSVESNAIQVTQVIRV